LSLQEVNIYNLEVKSRQFSSNLDFEVTPQQFHMNYNYNLGWNHNTVFSWIFTTPHAYLPV